MDMSQHPGILKYKNWRYLKVSSALVGLTAISYLFTSPAGGETYGGTWLGYVLGVISALLVLLLFWYGIAKRHAPKTQDLRQFNRVDRRKLEKNGQQLLYKRRGIERRKTKPKDSWRHGGTVQGWLSAHTYLGGALVVIASVHSGFQFDWNVHTLAYVLMLLVVASGLYGMYVYLNYPRMITLNLGSDTLEGLLSKIAELDEMARVRALGLPDDVNELILKSRRDTRFGGNLFQLLSGTSHINCPTIAATQKILELGQKYTKDNQPKLMRDLYTVLLRKERLLLRVRNEVTLKARLQFWLYVHAPLSIALLVALFVHILSILFYW